MDFDLSVCHRLTLSHLRVATPKKDLRLPLTLLGSEVTPRALRRKFPGQTQFGLYL